MDVSQLYDEVSGYLTQVSEDFGEPGEHLWSNYEKVTGFLIRLSQIRNDLSFLEIAGRASSEAKKFRTLVLDPSIERLEKVAIYESRKITATGIEAEVSK